MKLLGIAALLILTGGAAVADESQSPTGHSARLNPWLIGTGVGWRF